MILIFKNLPPCTQRVLPLSQLMHSSEHFLRWRRFTNQSQCTTRMIDFKRDIVVVAARSRAIRGQIRRKNQNNSSVGASGISDLSQGGEGGGSNRCPFSLWDHDRILFLPRWTTPYGGGSLNVFVLLYEENFKRMTNFKQFFRHEKWQNNI